MYESGIAGMRFSCSETAKWGDVSVGPKVVDESVKKRMKQILNEIQNGEFAKGWIGEYKNGLPTYKELLEQSEHHPIEEVGVRLRSLMPWVQKKNIKGAQAAY
jgi:ketol-acid reductoisomerase